MPIIVEVALAANQVEAILDELQVLGNRKNTRQFLELAVLASIRGLSALSGEPFVVSPNEYLAELEARFGSRESVREQLREDTTRLRLFLEAECRLLHDLGLSDRLVSRIRLNLAAVVRSSSENVEGLGDLLNEIVGSLETELGQLEDEGRHGAIIQKLVGVLQALGGALIVGGDLVVGAAATPVTAGLSAIGAGASGLLGTEVFSRGAKRVLG